MNAIDRAWARRPTERAQVRAPDTRSAPEAGPTPARRTTPEERDYDGWTALYRPASGSVSYGKVRTLTDVAMAWAIFKVVGTMVLFRKSLKHDPREPLTLLQAERLYGPVFN